MDKITIKPSGQRVGFERAVEARMAMKVSPAERNRQKILSALRWIHGWGQSTTEIVKLACRSTSGDFISKMKSRKLVRSERVLGTTFLQLTKTGVELLRNWSGGDDALAALPASRVVDLYAFHHNFYAQRLLAERVRRGCESGQWFCDRQIRSIINSTDFGGKCPDAWYYSATEKIFFEVERTKKKQPELEVMLLNISKMLERHSDSVCEIHIEPGISDRYRSTLSGWLSRGDFRTWSLGSDGKYTSAGIYTLHDSLESAMRRIKFIVARIRA